MSEVSWNNLFVSTTFAPNGSRVIEVVQELIRKGITNIELGSTHRYESNVLDQLKGLPCRFLVHNYFPIPQSPFVLNIASGDEAIRSRSVRHIMDAIDFCAEISAELYTFHPGFLTDPDGPSLNKANYDFIFRGSDLQSTSYDRAYNYMLNSIEKTVLRAGQKGVRIAIETEGSFKKKDHLLMQRPEEFDGFYRMFSPREVGVNLNIGHLNLAARAFGFKPDELLDAVDSALAGFEISHNYGFEDDHLPVEEDAWYWPHILKPEFRDIPKILETRETPISDIVDNIALCARRFMYTPHINS